MHGARRLVDTRLLAISEVTAFNGIEFVRDRETLEPATREFDFIIAEMRRKYRILLSSEGPHDNVLKVKPPAPFSADECDYFLNALDETLASLSV